MSAYAAWGFVALAWWTWPLLFAVVMSAMVGGLWVQEWLERRRTARAPMRTQPCLHYLGTDEDGESWWCWKVSGHADKHGYGEPDPTE